MKTAVIQLRVTEDRARNTAKAVGLIRRAIRRRAKFILLPEVFAFSRAAGKRGGFEKIAEEIPGKSLHPLMALARENKVFILAGSVYEKARGSRKVYNTSVLIDSRGFIGAAYRKIHLFDAVIGGRRIRESDYFLSGKKITMARIGEFKAGLSICYDVRFPQMYRQYARRGAHLLCVPSAFTRVTGRAHWEVLLRARAIENQCYVLAPNQVGAAGDGIHLYGHSMIIDPWGKVLAKARGTKEEIIFADVEMKTLRAQRRLLPSLIRGERVDETDV